MSMSEIQASFVKIPKAAYLNLLLLFERQKLSTNPIGLGLSICLAGCPWSYVNAGSLCKYYLNGVTTCRDHSAHAFQPQSSLSHCPLLLAKIEADTPPFHLCSSSNIHISVQCRK